MKDIFLGKSLVDHITKTLRSRLRSKSQAAFLDILHLAHDIQGKSIDSKRRQGNIDCLITEFIDQEVYDFFELTVVTGAQRT